LAIVTLETNEKMGGRRKTKEVQENGRASIDADAIQSPEPMKAGQKAANLRMRASPYQELACGRLKRKADCLTSDSSPDSTAGGVQSTLPLKPLKVIQHQFTNGENIRIGRRGATSEEAETIGQDSQNFGDDEGVRATPKHLMYKDTRSGRWRTTARQPRKYDYHLGSGGGQRPRKKSRHSSEDQVSEFRSEYEAVLDDKNEDRRGRDEAGESHHLCIGIACENQGCHTRVEFQNTFSTSLANQHGKVNKGAHAVRRRSALAHVYQEHHEFLEEEEPSHTLGQPFSHPAAFGLAADSLQPHQTPLLSMREMIGSLHPGVQDHGVDAESGDPPTEVPQIEHDGAANIFSKAVLRENHDEPHTDPPPSCVRHSSESVTSRQGPSLGITRHPSSTG